MSMTQRTITYPPQMLPRAKPDEVNHVIVCSNSECCLKAENERLRAVLESLTKDPPATLDEPDTDAEVIKKMRAIARRGLEQKSNLPTGEHDANG